MAGGLGGGADTRGVPTRSEGAVARVVDLPAYPTDAEWAKATAELDETIVYVSSGVGSFCTFADATDAVAFDRKMAVALQAESHFCESVVDVGGGGRRRDARATSGSTCRAAWRRTGLRRDARKWRLKRSFEARFDRRSPVGGEKRAPA